MPPHCLTVLRCADNQMLLPFALLGLLVYLVCLLLPGSISTYPLVAPLFCVTMVIFSALLQVRWTKKNQRLNYAWGITDYQPSDYTRPEFKGEQQWDFVKQRMTQDYPNWKRWLTIKPISLLVVLLQTLLLVVLSFALYVQLQDSLENPNPAYDIDILYWLFQGTIAVPVRTLMGAALNGALYGIIIMVCRHCSTPSCTQTTVSPLPVAPTATAGDDDALFHGRGQRARQARELPHREGVPRPARQLV